MQGVLRTWAQGIRPYKDRVSIEGARILVYTRARAGAGLKYKNKWLKPTYLTAACMWVSFYIATLKEANQILLHTHAKINRPYHNEILNQYRLKQLWNRRSMTSVIRFKK